ncbi:MAG: 16S rRNA (guanine(527)-N(7))-methyltransferase RsmG [Saprospiraceae bacterium]|nr:16S rRNA (guanine(527)-N(7))-methyltransferase RsmG [Saprospiraceae bacterium]
MELIHKYFPELDQAKVTQFEQLGELYREWNDKINVISRKDIDNLYLHHILHSLVIAKFIKFKDNTRVLDLGTGGGFPAIPLAIMFPNTQFIAIDGTRKKITVVNEIASAAGIKNVVGKQMRAEEHKAKYEFVVSRAVAKIGKLKEWTNHLIDPENQRHALPNGIIALKGGRIKDETSELSKKDYYEIHPLLKYINEPYFEEKFILYLQR